MIMNFNGIILGIAAFFSIGVFHPIVVKAEYYFGKNCWWAFALAGVFFVVLSLLVAETISSALFGVVGFSCFWSIFELFQQEERVAKGWFPKNPRRNTPEKVKKSAEKFADK